MKLVADMLGRQLPVQVLSANFEIVLVANSAIEINGLPAQLSLILLGQHEGIVLPPVRDIDGIAEYVCDHSRHWRRGPPGCLQFSQSFGNERRALRAYRSKQFWIGESEP